MHPERFEALSRSLADSTSRRGLLRLFGVGVLGTTVSAVGLNEALAKKKSKKKGKARQQSGGAGIGPVNTLTDIPVRAHEPGRNFKGTLRVTEFVERNGGIVALATLTGKRTGKGVGNKPITREVELPVSIPALEGGVQAQQVCDVLFLELGPITLDLLGLNVFIGGPNNTPLIVEITADPTGGLLGQLLSGLLCGGLGLPGDLLAILVLLNQLLDLLENL